MVVILETSGIVTTFQMSTFKFLMIPSETGILIFIQYFILKRTI